MHGVCKTEIQRADSIKANIDAKSARCVQWFQNDAYSEVYVSLWSHVFVVVVNNAQKWQVQSG